MGMGRQKKEDKLNAVATAPAGQPSATGSEPAVDVQKVKNEYLKVFYYQTKIKDGLLGTFSTDGKYKITNDQILQDLVNIPKKFEEKDGDNYYSSSRVGSHVLNFRVTLDISESYCNAHLALIEVEHGLDEDIKHVTELGDIVEPYSPKFKENVYKAWNIHLQEEEYEKTDFIYSYMHSQTEDYNFSIELTEVLSQLYLAKLLKLLEGCGELGAKIKALYMELIEKLAQKDPSIRLDHTRMKNILDRLMLSHKAFEMLLANKDAAAALAGYSGPLGRVLVRDNVVHVEKKEMKKDEKPAEKKAEDSGKKKGGKSKGGGGGSGGGAVKIDWGKLPKISGGGGGAVKFDSPAVKPTLKDDVPLAINPRPQIPNLIGSVTIGVRPPTPVRPTPTTPPMSPYDLGEYSEEELEMMELRQLLDNLREVGRGGQVTFPDPNMGGLGKERDK